ncbi:MAG: cyclic nucleotide-binding domain-containing protein [Myxococcaceae bacterium]|nr:cyclic nucleotide-binding domain-containing protein [Myxococcaceae bacterium]
MTAADRARVLQSIPIFEGLSPIDLDVIGARMSEQSFVKGSAVFRAGDPGDAIFFLVRGTVAIRDGQRVLVKLDAPECFGELAVLSNEARSADAICESSCDVLKLKANEFNELIATRPAVQRQMMLTLVKRVREAGRRSR